MTRIRPGEPGHGGRTACLRRRPVRIVGGVPQGGWTDLWEIVCPACGDDVDLDFVTVSPFLQRLRGPYPTEAEGLAALRKHRGQPDPTPDVSNPDVSNPDVSDPDLSRPRATQAASPGLRAQPPQPVSPNAPVR